MIRSTLDTRFLVIACAFALTIVGGAPARAQPPTLIFPVTCTYGQDCIIQNYVAWGGETPRDYRCGSLTYPTHKGTDIRVLDLETMERGVTVMAAAGGTVRGIRDGMADRSVKTIDKAGLKGRECGNGVLVSHADGWSTQYCHMKRGSIAVRSGDAVRAGTPLGQVGLSGNTVFPHLHFVVRQGDRVVDPFTGPDGRPACEGGGGTVLWDREQASALTYEPIRIFGAGFSGTPVSQDSVNADTTSPATISARSPVFLFWTRLIGLSPRYRVKLSVTDPRGTTIVDTWLDPVDRHKAEWVSWTGRRGPLNAWLRGTYRGAVTVFEGNRTVVTRTQQVRIGE
ncbi:MAG: M23 family metallopeptidase [Alphaproteobacteria bacterium]